MRKLVLLAFITLTLFNICIAQELKSPDGKICNELFFGTNGTPSYTLVYKGKVVIKPSKLGLELKSDAAKAGVGNDADMMPSLLVGVSPDISGS